MYKKEKKNHAYMAIIHKEDAFTLLEMLIVLSTIVITFPFILFLLQQIQYKGDDEYLSVTQFFVYLQKDAIQAEEVYHEHNTLYFTINETDTAQIEQYNDTVRRRVNNKGHEIYLRNVQSISVHPNKVGFHFIVNTTKGESYEKIIYTSS